MAKQILTSPSAYIPKNKFHLTNQQLRALHQSTNDQLFEEQNELYVRDSAEDIQGG